MNSVTSVLQWIEESRPPNSIWFWNRPGLLKRYFDDKLLDELAPEAWRALEVVELFGVYYTGPPQRMLIEAMLVAVEIKMPQTNIIQRCLANVGQMKQMANGERFLEETDSAVRQMDNEYWSRLVQTTVHYSVASIEGISAGLFTLYCASWI